MLSFVRKIRTVRPVNEYRDRSNQHLNSGMTIAHTVVLAAFCIEDNMKKMSVPIRANFTGETPILDEQEFLLRISLECRRAERSRKRFILVLLDGLKGQPVDTTALLAPIVGVIRETDIWGWFAESTFGIMFAELSDTKPESARDTIVKKIEGALQQAGYEEGIAVSAYILPRDLNSQSTTEGPPTRIYDIREAKSSGGKGLQLAVKRAIDVVGAASLLILLFPLMALIALAVKYTSKGPILFRQSRVGQRGKHFTFLKFRTMAVANDSGSHQSYVKDFIQGTASRNTNERGEGVFKLTHDPRVTRFGRVLRSTSLDELPQLWNVLIGEMSLVGPRPPIPYEVKYYHLWHQRRVLEVKPGITGLWQVRGRSRTCFDDMVRLDLQYARTWSPWLDIKILLQTPLAVLGGGGAH